MQKNQQPSKGFLIVGNRHYKFYTLALNLIESIKDYYPEAKICLVTEEKLCDGRETIADHILYCDDHWRAKLWALSKSPFDITMYIDADAQIIHKDIKTAFDYMQDNDMVFTELTAEREYCFAFRTWAGGSLRLCGGVFLYDLRKPLVKEFMTDWYEYYIKQQNGDWWPLDENGIPDYINHPLDKLKPWDQFTLWWLTEKNLKYKDLKIDIFEDDARWNYFSLYRERYQHTKKPPIIHHMSCLVNKGAFDYDN
jgi:hypothetical protein